MDYQFPVSMHRHTSEEFDKIKADYVAKYGYTIHIPGITDIIKFRRIKEPTKEENKAYRRKDIAQLGQARYDDLVKLKAEKKKSFLAMMSSPNPTWLTNIGSTMDFLDDINDTLGTLSVVLRAGAHSLPKILSKFMLGPAGWVWSAAQLVDFISQVLRSPIARAVNKNALKNVSTANPLSKEMKLRQKKFLKRIIPSKGEIIEGLQTSNNVLGWGLSLGPIVGALEEAFTGPLRYLSGHEVKTQWPIPKFREWELKSMEGLESAQQINQGADELPDEIHIKSFVAATMSIKALYPYFTQFKPLENLENFEYIIRTPPKLKSFMSRDILLESGINPDDHVGFLNAEGSNNTVQELSEIGAERIPAQALKLMERTKHSIAGYLMAGCMTDTAINGCALIEGEENVEIDFNPVNKALFTMADADYKFLTELTQSQIECFIRAVTILAPDPYNLPFKDLQYLLSTRCRIPVVRRPKPIITKPDDITPVITSITIGKL